MQLANGLSERLPAVQYDLTIGATVSSFPWRVASIAIDEDLSGGYHAVIQVENEAPDADREPLLGAEACLTIRRPGTLERRFPGVLRAVTSHGIDVTRVTHCTLELEPAFACLDEGVETRRFQDATVPQIVETVLRDKLAPYARESTFKLSRTADDGKEGRDTRNCFPPRPWCVQYAESAHAFIRRLLAEEGLSYFFETTEGKEKLVVVDENFGFPEHDGVLPLLPAHAAADREAITKFAIRQTRTPGRLTLRGANLTAGSPGLEGVALTPPTDAGQATRPPVARGDEEVYDGAAAPTLFRYQNHAFEKHDLDTQSRLRLEEHQVRHEVGLGTSFVTSLRAGTTFELDGGPGMRGKYLVTKVRHTGRARSLHRTAADTTADATDYENEFECIPAAIPFRPARLGKPVVRTLDRAVVTAPAAGQLWTERHGRVTVRFQWDRETGGPPDMTSYWVPVATVWAGAGYGVHFLPRAGMEVLVGYVGGDPDQPVILGCRESAQNSLPVTLSQEAAKSGIFTQSLRQGGQDHHHWSELSFDDQAEHEKVMFRAGWDYERLVLHDDKTTIYHDERRTVGNDQHVHVQGASEDIVEKDATVTVHGSRLRTIDKEDRKVVTEGDEILMIEKGARSVEVRSKDKLVAHADREQIIEGNDSLHVLHSRSVDVDDVLTVRQGETTVEWADGHIDVASKSWIRVRHAGAEVQIDEEGNLKITTDKQIEIASAGASIVLGDGKAAIDAADELTLSAGTGALKLDAQGATISGTAVKSTATTTNELLASLLVKIN